MRIETVVVLGSVVFIMSLSVSDIESLASELFHESRRERANQCARLTEILYLELCDDSRLNTSPERVVGGISFDGKDVAHKFLHLSASSVGGVTDGPVIIDPTIQQFCDANKSSSKVNVAISIEGEYELPESVGVYTPNDDEYELYSW